MRNIKLEEKALKLIHSSDNGDVMIGLQLLKDYTLDEFNEILELSITYSKLRENPNHQIRNHINCHLKYMCVAIYSHTLFFNKYVRK